MVSKATNASAGTGVILWLASCLSAVAVLPYMSALAPGSLSAAALDMQISETTLIAISLGQSIVLLGVTTFSGLWAARKLALGAPLIDAMLNNRSLPNTLQKAIACTVTMSLAVVGIIYALEATVFKSVAVDIAQQSQGIELWKRALASFYGGVAEEIQLRLFLLSMAALAIRFLANVMSSERKDTSGLTNRVFWTANVLTAIFFGILHLPVAAELMPLTPLFVTRIILLNGSIGLIAGLFFRRYGIELAILFHFTVDVLLHVILPMLA